MTHEEGTLHRASLDDSMHTRGHPEGVTIINTHKHQKGQEPELGRGTAGLVAVSAMQTKNSHKPMKHWEWYSQVNRLSGGRSELDNVGYCDVL